MIELCLSIQVCKRETHAVRAKKYRLHLSPLNVVDIFIWVSVFLFLCFVLTFFAIAIVKQLHYAYILTSGVTSHCILLHPVSSRTSRASGLRIQFIQYSSPIDYPII